MGTGLSGAGKLAAKAKAAAGSANPATPNVTTPKKFEVSEKGFQDALEAFSR